LVGCPFGANGPKRTPIARHRSRKLSRTGKSRAILRRELAHPQDTNTPAHEQRPLQAAAPSTGFAEPSDADARHQPDPPGQLRDHMRAAPCTRPDRPPSRPRNRPRATGTSEPDAALREGTVPALVCLTNRTCVRTVGGPADGSDANMCTCRA
jgi:hypothetical protein